MNLLAIVALFLLCAALAFSFSLRRSAWRDTHVAWPYYARKPLASPEHVLYQRLVAALPGHIVMFHVPLDSVLGVKRGIDLGLWEKRIHHLHYDFVVCTPEAIVLAAIELDGKTTHENAQADWFKDRASAAAGFQLIRWPARALPDQAAIQQVVGELETQYAEGFSTLWWPSTPSDHSRLP